MQKNPKVDFIGIGAPKAGTTWLFNCLSAHPEICTGKVKEIGFFLNENYEKGLPWYLNHFEHCNTNYVSGEFTPNYLRNAEIVAPRIKEHFPNAKLIVSLRNPIERFLSQHYFEYAMGRHGVLNPEEIPEERLKRILDQGLYYKNLSTFLDLFPENQVLVLIYRDIEENPREQLAKVYKFLGVDPSFIPTNINKRSNVTELNRTKIRSIKRAYYRGQIFFTKHPFGRRLAPLIKAVGLATLAKKTATFLTSDGKSPMKNKKVSIKMRRQIQSFYKEDIINLEKLLNRDLSFWT